MEVPETAAPKTRRTQSNIYIFASFAPSSIYTGSKDVQTKIRWKRCSRGVTQKMISVYLLFENQSGHFPFYTCFSCQTLSGQGPKPKNNHVAEKVGGILRFSAVCSFRCIVIWVQVFIFFIFHWKVSPQSRPRGFLNLFNWKWLRCYIICCFQRVKGKKAVVRFTLANNKNNNNHNLTTIWNSILLWSFSSGTLDAPQKNQFGISSIWKSISPFSDVFLFIGCQPWFAQESKAKKNGDAKKVWMVVRYVIFVDCHSLSFFCSSDDPHPKKSSGKYSGSIEKSSVATEAERTWAGFLPHQVFK